VLDFRREFDNSVIFQLVSTRGNDGPFHSKPRLKPTNNLQS